MVHISYDQFMNSEKGVIVPVVKKHVTIREIVVVCLTIAFVLAAGGCCIALVMSQTPDTTTTVIVDVNVTTICTSHPCLFASAEMVAFRDSNIDPCDDFYRYACGNWQKYETESAINPDEREKTIPQMMRHSAEENILKVLTASTKSGAPAYERKVKDFYASCIDDYGISVMGAWLFIENVLKEATGWNVLPTETSWDESSFSLTAGMKAVHSKFWKDALFRVSVGGDWIDYTKNVVQIGLGGMTLRWWDYIDTTDKHIKLFEATKTFMKTVSKLVMRDSGKNMTEAQMNTKAEEFANDVFNFESKLANTTWHTLPSDDPHANENRVSVSELNGIADEFDWVDILTTMFAKAGVTRDTKVVLLERDFLGKVNALVKGLDNKVRVMNNYFTWRLMLGYVTDLGWEYVHANRVFYVARTGNSEFLGIPKYCFNKVEYHFSDGLGALYIRDHMHKNDKDTVHNIVKYLKEGLIDRLNSITWMESPSKAIGVDKVKKVVEKLGYPSWMASDNTLNIRYQNLTITQGDYLSNLIAIGQYEREKINDQLIKGADQSVWRKMVWDTWGRYDLYWNELLVSAGMLQWPLYGKNFPKYYNFGTMGVLLSHQLTHSVDEIGGYYLPNGTYFDWWTKNTTSLYNVRRKCLESLNITAGPYQLTPDSPLQYVKIDGTFVAREVIADVGGLRMSYYAYKDWIADNKPEKTAPGIELTNEQTMFLAYAQTQCFARRDDFAISRAERHEMPEDVKLNLALAHTPEFSQAFKCKDSSKMKAQKMCEVF